MKFFDKIVLLLILVVFLTGCGMNVQQIPNAKPMDGAWKDAVLKDVSTGESFKMSDFKGKTVLLESFAVWCPTCKKQQDKIKDLHLELGDSIVSISLDTDPNEKDAEVLEHATKYGYDWRFVVSPVELTSSLIKEFSVAVVNAPGAPIVHICEDQS